MNFSSDPAPSQSAAHPAGGAQMEHPLPANWREALLSLIASRVTLIQLESKDAAKAGLNRTVLLIAVVICAFFTWALLLAGGIAAISQATAWPWYWIAIAAAIIHLIAALLLVRAASKPGQPAFPVTRAEFQKDREWIENFQTTRKSNV